MSDINQRATSDMIQFNVTCLVKVANQIHSDQLDQAKKTLSDQYPFTPFVYHGRSYSVKQKMTQFLKDGFIDRYSGDKLFNIGLFKVISTFFPKEFPYHPNWKTSTTHPAYWELTPTIDHIVPIAHGGTDSPGNWATTSMLHNSVKSQWTLDQPSWQLHSPGNIREWDGLTNLFIQIVNKNNLLLADQFIKSWYQASLEGIRKYKTLDLSSKKVE